MLLLLEGERHRCSDRCLYAKGSQCDCSCEGRNHGMMRAWVEGEKRPAVAEAQRELFEQEAPRAG